MIESSSVRRALSQLREEISPTRDDKARLRARIVAPAALIAGASGQDAASATRAARDAASAPGAAPVAALGRWAALKAAGAAGATALVTGGLALLGVGGGVGFWLGQEAGMERARSVAAVEAPAASGVATVTRVAPAAVGAPPLEAARAEGSSAAVAPSAVGVDVPRTSESRRADVAPRAHARRPPRASPINDELALLRRVERALRNNDPALARALLGELDERFPDSRLGEERAAARRIADCRSGEPDALASARAFLREHGASVYRQRIVRACALEGEPKEKSAESRSGAAPMTNADGADTHVR